MLQSVAAPASYTLQTRLSRPELHAARRSSSSHNNEGSSNLYNNHTDTNHNPMADADAHNHLDGLGSDDDGDGGGKAGKSKSRRELPAGAVATLKAWLLSPEHFTHPYPTPQDQAMLMQKTGIDKKQLKNWFTNARRRIWKPMLKKQIEQGKLTTTGAAGVPGVVPGLVLPGQMGGTPGQSAMDNPHSVQAMRAHYQQAAGHGQPQQQVTVDAYGNQIYVQQQPPPQYQQQHQQQHHQPQPPPQQQDQSSHSVQPQYFLPPADTSSSPSNPPPLSLRQSSSIGSLPPMNNNNNNNGSSGQLNKTDSHAVLMELFARDQDLVRQATESARMKAAAKKQDGTQDSSNNQGGNQGQTTQHPMKSNASQSRITGVPSLNSWPHFSSISSLNNLGTMPGVKSITSLSGVDLANQGNVNKMGNLAQVKSMESMGKNDSYAFLEVFFGDRSMGSMANLAKHNQGGGGPGSNSGGDKGRRDRQQDLDDNDVGLSLDDEGPTPSSTSAAASLKPMMGGSSSPSPPDQGPPQPAPLSGDGQDSGTLKRAYDDAMAARGLMSVSRSSEKLTDLPAKMQRSLSQEYIRQHQNTDDSEQFGQFSYTPMPAPAPDSNSSNNSGTHQQQYPGQHPGDQRGQQFQQRYMSDPNDTNASVEVPAATKCALCHQTSVDTQLRPCGHMFHERCLKPSFQANMEAPKCPVDHIPMQSALLAIPTDDPQGARAQHQKWSSSSNNNNNQGVLSADRHCTPG